MSKLGFWLGVALTAYFLGIFFGMTLDFVLRAWRRRQNKAKTR